jgi:hypothetical protein
LCAALAAVSVKKESPHDVIRDFFASLCFHSLDSAPVLPRATPPGKHFTGVGFPQESGPQISHKPSVPRALYVEPWYLRGPRTWQTWPLSVAAGDSSTSKRVTLSAYSDTCTPTGGGSVEVGDKVFPWQGVFPFSSHTCLAWEGPSCRPASPLSPLARGVCPACDLLSRALVCSCTHTHTASHSTAPVGCSLPFPPYWRYRCRIHRCYRCEQFAAHRCYRCSTFAAQARQKLADHPPGFAHLSAHQSAFSHGTDNTAWLGFFLLIFLQVPPSRPSWKGMVLPYLVVLVLGAAAPARAVAHNSCLGLSEYGITVL